MNIRVVIGVELSVDTASAWLPEVTDLLSEPDINLFSTDESNYIVGIQLVTPGKGLISYSSELQNLLKVEKRVINVLNEKGTTVLKPSMVTLHINKVE